MRVSLRSRLFLSFFIVMIIALIVPGVWARFALQERIQEEMRSRALTEAYHLRAMLMVTSWDTHTLADFVQAVASAAHRMTVLDQDGEVVADSAVRPEALATIDVGDDLPEIAQALEHGIGTSMRRSHTTGLDMVYAAVRIPAGTLPAPLDHGGLLRVGMPPSVVQTHLDTIFRNWFVVLGSVLVLAPVLAMLLARKIEAPIRNMVEVIGHIATSDKRLHRLYPTPGGEFTQLADAVNDMAERIELSIATIEAQRAQLETILRVMEEGVLVLGSQGRIRMANDMLARLFPLVADAEGRHPIEAIPSAEFQEAVDSLLAQPGDGPTSTRLQIEPRRNLILSVQLVRPHPPQHAVVAVAVFHNVTELVHLMRIRRDFVANVSHELRTPLTSIQGYAETMAELRPDDETMRARCLDIIRRQAAQMSRLVEDLLILTRLESSSLPLDLRDVKLADLARRVAHALEALAEARNLHLKINIADDLHASADEHFLSQVFRNLLENACRYGPPGTDVEVNAFRNGDELIASVRDHGCGIPPLALKRVFERFYQVEPRRSGSRSSGLGLAICKHIVERHGGHIWAENTPGGTIRFSLPLAEAPERPHEERHA